MATTIARSADDATTERYMGPDGLAVWAVIAGQPVHQADAIVVGRSSDGAGRVPGDPYLSARHVQLTPHPDGTVTVTDLASRNGTWIGAERVRTKTLSGAIDLRVGRTLLRVAARPPCPHGREAAGTAANSIQTTELAWPN